MRRAEQAFAPTPKGAFQQGLSLTKTLSGPDEGAWTPADCTIAAGPSHLVAAINSSWHILDKASGKILASHEFYKWFASLPQLNLTSSSKIFDPKVLYDHFAGKFIFTCFYTTSSRSYCLISGSTTSDPLGRWYFYALDQGDLLFDYPQLGLDSKGIYVSGNFFDYTNQQFQYSRVLAIPRTIYTGKRLPYVYWQKLRDPDDNAYSFTLQPAVTYGNPGREFLMNSKVKSGSANRLFVWSITDPFGSSAKLALEAEVPVSPYSIPPNAVQPNSSQRIDTGDTRLLATLYQDDKLYTVHHVKTPNLDRVQVKYYRVNARSWAVQRDVYLTDGNRSLYYANIVVNPNGHLVIGTCVSGSNDYASYAYSGMLASNPVFSSVGWIVRGRTQYTWTNKGRVRWGDYTGAARDMADGKKAWLFGLYPNSNTSWKTNIAELYYSDRAYDTVGPMFTGPLKPSVTAKAFETFTISVWDSQGLQPSTARYRANGKWKDASCTGASGSTAGETITLRNVPMRASGYQQIEIRIDDMAGNSTLCTANVLSDRQRPTGGIEIEPQPFTQTRSVVLKLSWSDGSGSGVSAMQVRNFGSLPGPWIAPPVSRLNWTLTAGDGVKRVGVKFRDRALNESVVYWDATTLDTTPPSGPPSLDSPSHTSGICSNESGVVLTWVAAVDPLSGIEGYALSWDHLAKAQPSTVNLAATAIKTTVQVGDSTVGWHFHLRARDNAGNWGLTQDAGPFMIDTVKPTGTISVSPNPTPTVAVIVHLTWDDPGGCGVKELRLRNAKGSWTAWQAPVSKIEWNIPWIKGRSCVEAQFRDQAGNESQIVSACTDLVPQDYYVDPVSGIDAVTGGSAKNPWKTITYALVQTANPIWEMRYHLAPGTYSKGESFPLKPIAPPSQPTPALEFIGAGRDHVTIAGGFKIGVEPDGVTLRNLTCKDLTYEAGYLGLVTNNLSVIDVNITGSLIFNSSGDGWCSYSIIRSHIERIRMLFPGLTAGVHGSISDCEIGAAGARIIAGWRGSLDLHDLHVTGKMYIAFREPEYVSVKRCVFVGGGLELVSFGGSKRTFEVSDCTISHAAGPGITLQVQSLYFTAVRTVSVRDTAVFGCVEGIRISHTLMTDITIDGCLVVDNQKSGIDYSGNLESKCSITGCVILNNGGVGVSATEVDPPYLGSANAFEVRASIIARNGTGVRLNCLSGSKSTFGIDGCTLVDNKVTGIDRTNVPSSNASVTNTIIAGVNPLGSNPWPVSYCLSDKATLAGSKNIRGNPGFLNRNNGDYRLSLSSAAIDAGDPSPSVGEDFEGDPRALAYRSSVAVRDIGADEFSLAGVGHTFGPSTPSPAMPRLNVVAKAALKIGGQLAVEVKGPRNPDTVLWVLGSTEGQLIDLWFLGHRGVPAYLNPQFILAGSRKATGEGTLTIPLPNNLNILGIGVALQALVVGKEGISTSALMRFAIGCDKSITSASGMKLQFIPTGAFVMGSPTTEPGRNTDETLHAVKLTKPFYIGVTQVTQAEWKRVMGANSNPSKFVDDNRPVESVTRKNFDTFMTKLSALDGVTYRLPTEAEWEFACRAGSQTSFYYGDDWKLLAGYAWFRSNSVQTTHAVGQKKPNAFGLYDMHGNVREWCSDWYGSYPTGTTIDPTGPKTGTERVYRGGSWYDTEAGCRSAFRGRGSSNLANSKLGFRVVRM